jgi:hypothetical protein
MPDVNELNRRVKIDFFRERQLELENVGQVTAEAAADNSAEVEELANNYKKVANKGRTIRAELVRLAITRRVPVPPAAREVRAAVMRQDPNAPDGAFITFELYEKSLSYVRHITKTLPPEILDGLTGDPLTDTRNLTESILSSLEGIARDQAAQIASQVIILFMLKMLQKGTDALDTAEQTSVKAPPATEVPSVVKNIALSIAAAQLYTAMTEADLEQALKELAGTDSVPMEGVEAARSELRESPMFQSALAARRPSDFQTIIRFTEAFLNRQTEPGWETWQLLSALDDHTEWADEANAALQRYVREQPLSSQTVNDAVNTALQVDIRSSSSRAYNPNNRVDFADSKLGNEAQRIYGRGLEYLNRTMDKIAQVLSGIDEFVELCCLLRFFELQDRDHLAGIRTTLEMVQNTVDALDSLGASNRTSVQLSFSTQIHQAVMLLYQDLQQGFMARIKTWLSTETDKWNELFKCRLIDELVEYIVRGLEKVDEKLTDLLDRYLGYIEDQEAELAVTIDTVGNQKNLRSLMAIIDMVLNFQGPISEVCPETPDPGTLARSTKRVLDGLGGSISLPLGGDPFENVASGPVILDTGIVMPPPLGATAGLTIEEAAAEVCRRGLVDMNIVPFPRG